jgi:hypothetical protein
MPSITLRREVLHQRYEVIKRHREHRRHHLECHQRQRDHETIITVNVVSIII